MHIYIKFQNKDIFMIYFMIFLSQKNHWYWMNFFFQIDAKLFGVSVLDRCRYENSLNSIFFKYEFQILFNFLMKENYIFIHVSDFFNINGN